MAELSNQYYELAFHISSNLEEADVQKTRQDLEKMVTSNGGVITFAKDPEKIRLAYPIKHQMNAYFGHFNFTLAVPEDSVQKIRDEIRLNNNVLRFLILKHMPQPKADKEDLVRRLAMAEKRRVRAMKAAEKPVGHKEVAPADEKAIDEKLEEIIDKL